MERFLDDRAKRVIEELLVIQAELSETPSAPPVGLATPKLSPELVHQLKSAVDHVRLLLWAYIDSRYDASGDQWQKSLQKARLERTTEMLRALRDEISKAGMPRAPEAHLFQGEVEAMAQLVAQRPSS